MSRTEEKDIEIGAAEVYLNGSGGDQANGTLLPNVVEVDMQYEVNVDSRHDYVSGEVPIRVSILRICKSKAEAVAAPFEFAIAKSKEIPVHITLYNSDGKPSHVIGLNRAFIANWDLTGDGNQFIEKIVLYCGDTSLRVGEKSGIKNFTLQNFPKPMAQGAQ